MQVSRIPKCVPIGTKYIVESKSVSECEVHILSRCLVFPDGRRFDLTSDDKEFAVHREKALKATAS